MVDCASFLGRERLPRSYPISLKEFEGAMDAQGTHVEAGDVVLVRTGQMGAWPDTVAWDATRGAGITLPVAEKLIDGGVVAIGGDTEGVEVMPSVEPGNPHPVHIKALIEEGVYLLENLFLEQLSNDKVYEFLFISLAPKIKGATGSFVRPVAII
jgi:kynurenine formamidase